IKARLIDKIRLNQII
ncbi:hypothetical protein MIMGU_mgv1a0262232mg, partial [Erythranthe guttata]